MTGWTTEPVWAGLMVSSRQTASSATAQFSSVSITTGVPVLEAVRRPWGPMPQQPEDYTSQGLTVRIFLKHGGASPARLTVSDKAPTSWTIPMTAPPATISGSSITWQLASFSQDTTLTYWMTTPHPIPVGPEFFGDGLVVDHANSITVPLAGTRVIRYYRAMYFQQGRYPQSSYTGAQDTHILMLRSTGPGNPGLGMNTGWHDELEEGGVGTSLAGDQRTILLRFDTSAISPAMIVFDARLRLYHVRNRQPIGGGNPSSGTTHRIYAAKINRAWGEGRGIEGPDGAYANQDEASWFWARAGLSPWGSGGTRGGAPDSDMPESYCDASTQTIGTWLEWDVTEMVRQWTKYPSTNQGLRLSQDDENTTHFVHPWGHVPGVCSFASGNHWNLDLRPVLVVYGFYG